MPEELLHELKRLLPKSDSKLRKHWASRIINENISVADLMVLLHGDKKIAQRFMWLIGDLLEQDRNVVRPILPMLFELRNDMPFPGMRRSVAKSLWFLGVPKDLELEAVPQLAEWLSDDSFRVGVKHFAAKALADLVREQRFEFSKFDKILAKQAAHTNLAHAARMKKLKAQLIADH